MIVIQQLYTKKQSGQAMQKVDSILLEKNKGIIGDIHARVGSPRQVLVTTKDDYDALGLQQHQLRANIVLNGITQSDLQSGDLLSIGKTQIRITYICEPCRHLLELEGFEVDNRKEFNTHRGMLGTIISGGEMAIDDGVIQQKSIYPFLPDDNFERFCFIARTIPGDQYISYGDIVFLMGAPKAYVRAIPGYISKAQTLGIDCGRILAQEYIDSLSHEQLWDFSNYFQN